MRFIFKGKEAELVQQEVSLVYRKVKSEHVCSLAFISALVLDSFFAFSMSLLILYVYTFCLPLISTLKLKHIVTLFVFGW